MVACGVQWPLVHGFERAMVSYTAVSELQVIAAGLASFSLDEFAACVTAHLMPRLVDGGMGVRMLHRQNAGNRADGCQPRFGEHSGLDAVASLTSGALCGSAHCAKVATASLNVNAAGESLAALGPEQRSMCVEAAVMGIVLQLTGAPEAVVKATTPLSELGLDSLGAIEMSSQLNSLFGIVLSANTAVEYPSIQILTAHVLEQIGGATHHTDTASTPSTTHAAGTLLDRVPLQLDDTDDDTDIPMTIPMAELDIPPWVVLREGSDMYGSQLISIETIGGSLAAADGGDRLGNALVFIHSIVGQLPIPSLRRLRFALGGALDVFAMPHAGLSSGLDDAFATVAMGTFAQRYAGVLAEALPDCGLSLIGLSWGATLTQCVGIAALEQGLQARQLVLVDPNPPTPHPVLQYELARNVTLRLVAFNCIFGVVDGSVALDVISHVAHELENMPEDALAAYVTSVYTQTGGIAGTVWDVMRVARELRIYRHSANVLASMQVGFELPLANHIACLRGGVRHAPRRLPKAQRTARRLAEGHVEREAALHWRGRQPCITCAPQVPLCSLLAGNKSVCGHGRLGFNPASPVL